LFEEHEFTLTLTEDKGVLPLNAYLLTHGQPTILVIANDIRRGDLWYLLEDLTLTLKTIRSTVEHLLIRTSANELPESGDDLAVDGLNLAEADPEEEGLDSATIVKRLLASPTETGGFSRLWIRSRKNLIRSSGRCRLNLKKHLCLRPPIQKTHIIV
jgi:hypothetical protein